jgi:predicted anti-sigma-YlaC factor YlaD
MECSSCRDLISADLDDEADDAEQELLFTHLGSCAACRGFHERATGLTRAVRVRPAEPVPDLSAAILARVPGRPTAPIRVREWARYGLVVVALTQLVLAVPELLMGASANQAVHLEHHLGAWDIAMAVGLLVAAWQPERARGLLPMAVALGGILLATGLLDLAAGNTAALSEVPHALELLGVLFLWFLTKRPARPAWRVLAS